MRQMVKDKKFYTLYSVSYIQVDKVTLDRGHQGTSRFVEPRSK